MSRMPPLTSLRAFEAAARHLSFTRAAQELHVTQAAVSHQVKTLEDFLGQPLFLRLTRALELTPAGEGLAPVLKEAFESIERATRRLMEDQDRQGVLNVSVSPTILSRWLIPRLSSWQEAHPEIELRLVSTPKLADFVRDGVDVAIRHGRGVWTGLAAHRLFQAKSVPVCSPELLAGPIPLNKPEDLARHTLLHDLVEPDGWRIWLTAAGVKEIDPERGMRLGTGVDALEAAIAGAGVALARRVIVRRDVEAGRLAIPFEVPMPKDFAFYVVYPEGSAKRPKVKAFLDWALAEAKTDAEAEEREG
ncbi:MAG: transcriptional regulator GcvA [Rhodospirillales bacterium]|nr:MAG: transcriptional regulator GcvA [Rhodospirillales bacterium]